MPFPTWEVLVCLVTPLVEAILYILSSCCLSVCPSNSSVGLWDGDGERGEPCSGCIWHRHTVISCSGMLIVPCPQVPHYLSLTNPVSHSKGMIISSEFFTVYKNLGVWEVVGQKWGWFWFCFSSSHGHYFTFIRSFLFVCFILLVN